MSARIRVPSAWDWWLASKSQSPLDPVVEAAFFTSIRVSNGTFKTTCAGRIDDFNQIITASLRSIAAGHREPLQALDVGVSSGITTLEWANLLESLGLRFHLVATDLTATAILSRYTKWFHALVDNQGTPMQYQLLGISFRGGCCPGDVVRLKFLPIRLAQLAHILLQKAGWGTEEQITLVVSDVLANPAIEVRSDDIFCDDPAYHGRFHVVRAANILNQKYFAEDKLQTGVLNLTYRLREGGILAICRTRNDASNHGSLFRLSHGRLVKIEQFGEGSDVDDLCEQTSLRAAA